MVPGFPKQTTEPSYKDLTYEQIADAVSEMLYGEETRRVTITCLRPGLDMFHEAMKQEGDKIIGSLK